MALFGLWQAQGDEYYGVAVVMRQSGRPRARNAQQGGCGIGLVVGFQQSNPEQTSSPEAAASRRRFERAQQAWMNSSISGSPAASPRRMTQSAPPRETPLSGVQCAPGLGKNPWRHKSALDWPTAAPFRELSAACPSAKFVLTYRSPENRADSFGATIYKLLAGSGAAPPEMKAWLEMAGGVIAKSGFPGLRGSSRSGEDGDPGETIARLRGPRRVGTAVPISHERKALEPNDDHDAKAPSSESIGELDAIVQELSVTGIDTAVADFQAVAQGQAFQPHLRQVDGIEIHQRIVAVE